MHSPKDQTGLEKRELDLATGIMTVPDRDQLNTDFANKLLVNFYLNKGETVQEGFARASKAWCGGDDALAQRLYDGVSKGWFMFASPVLSNAPSPGKKAKGMPISCFLLHTGDSIQSLIDHTAETRWLSVMGGGVGAHWGDVRSVSDKAPGPIPFLHTMDADMEAYRQGKIRRGSYAAYLDISHPDIVEFLTLRQPTGDATRKCHSTGFHHGINITDAFMRAMLKNEPWDLIDPADKTVRETVNARDLWEQILEVRYRTGEPYLYFIDAAQRALPESQKQLGLTTNGSNLCIEITLPTNEERTAVCCLSSLNGETYDEWKDSSIVSDLVTMLDNVLTYFIENAPDALAKAKYSAMRERAIGLGLMGFHSYLQKHMVAFESERAREINKEIFTRISTQALLASHRLAEERGEAPDMAPTFYTFYGDDGKELRFHEEEYVSIERNGVRGRVKPADIIEGDDICQ